MMKAGSAVVLKGGSDAQLSNEAIVRIIADTLAECGFPAAAAQLLPPSHEATAEMLDATGLIDLIIPRGGRALIDFVRDYLKAGLPLEEAAMDAGAVRLRPILLTTLAIIFGSVVMITDPVFSGLAISFIFGTAASTVFTVFLIPILLTFYYKRWPYKPDATKL